MEAQWRDANDKDAKKPLEGHIIITLERWTKEKPQVTTKTKIVEEVIGPCREITDEQRMADNGDKWETTTKKWSLLDPIVKNCKDGDVLRFEYKVGSQGCKIQFKRFEFNILWTKSEALKKDEG